MSKQKSPGHIKTTLQAQQLTTLWTITDVYNNTHIIAKLRNPTTSITHEPHCQKHGYLCTTKHKPAIETLSLGYNCRINRFLVSPIISSETVEQLLIFEVMVIAHCAEKEQVYTWSGKPQHKICLTKEIPVCNRRTSKENKTLPRRHEVTHDQEIH